MQPGAEHQPTKGEALEEIFKQLDPINKELDELIFTPSGRIRRTYTDEQSARLDELSHQQEALSRRAINIVNQGLAGR